MRPQLQHHRGGDGVPGDCYRTCIAMVMDLDRDEVPHWCADVGPGVPVDDPRHIASVHAERAWLADRGVATACTAYNPGMTVDMLAEQLNMHSHGTAAIVLCTIGGEQHAIVLYNGQVYDPMHKRDHSFYQPALEGVYWLVFLVMHTKPLPAAADPATVATQED